MLERGAVDCNDDVRSEVCVCQAGGVGGNVSTGNVSYPAERQKQIFPCDGWHHSGGLCIVSPLKAASHPLNLHWEGVGDMWGGNSISHPQVMQPPGSVQRGEMGKLRVSNSPSWSLALITSCEKKLNNLTCAQLWSEIVHIGWFGSKQ